MRHLVACTECPAGVPIVGAARPRLGCARRVGQQGWAGRVACPGRVHSFCDRSIESGRQAEGQTVDPEAGEVRLAEAGRGLEVA